MRFSLLALLICLPESLPGGDAKALIEMAVAQPESALADAVTLANRHELSERNSPEAMAASFILAMHEIRSGHTKVALARIRQSRRFADSDFAMSTVWHLLSVGAETEAAAALKLIDPDTTGAAAARALLAIRKGELRTAQLWLSATRDSPLRDLILAEWYAARQDNLQAAKALERFCEAPSPACLMVPACRLQADILLRLRNDLNRAYGSAVLAWRLAPRGSQESLKSGLLTSHLALLHGEPTVSAAITSELAAAFPDSPEVHNQSAYALSCLGLVKEAELALNMGTASPEFFHIAAKARLLSWSGTHDKARQLWDQVLKQKPNRIIALTEMSTLLSTCAAESIRDGDLALSLAERGLEETGGQLAAPFLCRALALLELERFSSVRQPLLRYATKRDRFDYQFNAANQCLRKKQAVRRDSSAAQASPQIIVTGTGPKIAGISSEHELILRATKLLRQGNVSSKTRLESYINESYVHHVNGDYQAAMIANEKAATFVSNRNEELSVLLPRFVMEMEAELTPLAGWDDFAHPGISEGWIKARLLLRNSKTMKPEHRRASLKTAEKSLHKLINKRENASVYHNAENYEVLAEVHLESGNFEQALRAVNRSLRKYRAHETAFAARTWLLRGRILFELGQLDAALWNASVARQLQSDVRGFSTLAGRIHLAAGRLNLARFRIEEALSQAGDDPVVRAPLLTLMAEISIRQNDEKEMLSSLASGFRMLPASPDAWREHKAVWDVCLNGAECLLAVRRDRDALKFLDRAVQTGVDSPRAGILKARLLACSADDRIRDGAAALKLADQLAADAGLNPDLIAARACALAELGRFEEAVSGLKSARFLFTEDEPGLPELIRLQERFESGQRVRKIPLRIAKVHSP